MPVGVGPRGLRLMLRVARPDATPGPGLPRPGDGLVVLYRLLLLRVAQSWLTGAAQGRGTAIFFLINGIFAGGRYQIKGRTNTGERNLFHPAARVTARPPFARACKWYLKRFKTVSAESNVSVHDDSRLVSCLSARSVPEHFLKVMFRHCDLSCSFVVFLSFVIPLLFGVVVFLSFFLSIGCSLFFWNPAFKAEPEDVENHRFPRVLSNFWVIFLYFFCNFSFYWNRAFAAEPEDVENL